MRIKRRVILKPVVEAEYREIDDVIQELDHDPLIAWIYRDPIDVGVFREENVPSFFGRIFGLVGPVGQGERVGLAIPLRTIWRPDSSGWLP